MALNVEQHLGLDFMFFYRKELEDESFLEYMTRHDLHQHEAYRIYSF